MSILKILHLADQYEGGGAESVFRDTIKISEQLNFINKVIFSNSKTNPISYVFSIKYFIITMYNILKFKPNVIHLHNYYHFLSPSILIAIKAARLCSFKFKVIFTAHDYHLICPNSGFQYFTKTGRKNFNYKEKNMSYSYVFDERSYLHSLLKKIQHFLNYKILLAQNVIDVIVSPSYFLKEVFEIYGVKQKIHVIRNPIDLAKKVIDENAIVEPEFYTETNSNNPIRIVFIGRVTPEKGLKKFVTLLEKNIDKFYEIHIFGVGEELADIINRKINSDKLTIITHGFVPREELPTLIKNYDLFVLPSLWVENAPISVIEAAKQGLPVLVPDYGGLKEMAELTEFFFFFDLDNPYTLSSVIDMAITKRKQNKIIDEEIFSRDIYKEKIKEIYTT